MATSMWKMSGFLGQKIPRYFQLCSCYRFSSQAVSSVAISDVQYPPMLPMGDEKKYLKTVAEIKNAPTVSDMIYLLNKRQCWHYQMSPTAFHPNFLQVYTHATKTHIVEGLPKYVTDFVNSDRISQLAGSVKDAVQKFVAQEMVFDFRHSAENRFRKDSYQAKCFMDNVVNHFLLTEIGQCSHILAGELDHDVEVKSFWEREDSRYEKLGEPQHTRFQYLGKPTFLLRTTEPLQEFTSRDSELSVGEVAPYQFKPQWFSIMKKHHTSMCFPGLKHGNPINYGHTQVCVTDYQRKKLLELSQSYHDEVILGHGMMSSFGWMAGLSMFHKHYWDDDLTQPMTCNTIVTDGKNFSFFCYQLNTVALHGRVSETNKLRNVCWHTKDAQLYEAVTEEGEIVNFNEDVLKTIIGMLLMPPGTNMLETLESSEQGQLEES